jgi:hypothetical protein
MILRFEIGSDDDLIIRDDCAVVDAIPDTAHPVPYEGYAELASFDFSRVFCDDATETLYFIVED